MAVALLSACASADARDSPPALHGPATAEWLAIDSILRAAYPAQEPGAVAIVARDGEVVYRGAVGMANLELGVPLRPEMVFQVASITKQFAGVAILLLAEEGKLALSDPLTRFFPDYPVGGRTVTVEHLLGHTSGIRNYTAIPGWSATMRNDVTTEQLIAVFRDQPFQFEPGEQFAYNNSGYVLLGAIIEQLSGMPYGEFIRTRVLAPLGMTSSHLALATAVIPSRTPGYTRTPNGWTNAQYYSLTQPHASGALLSSADDLARWDAAITRSELVSPDSWRRAFTPIALNDGTSTRYGAGWFIGRIGHLATVEHGGTMPGFSLYALRVPEARLFVTVLSNSLSPGQSATAVALELARHTLNIPAEAPEVAMASARLDEYVGRYRHGEDDLRTVTRQGDRLHSQRGSGPTFELRPIGEDLFALAGTDGSELRFTRRLVGS
jgi:D-alanyl-D-alanine carboxypeptidase